MKLLREIVIDQFPTHMAITSNKTRPDKMVKINNQIIYNQQVKYYTRAKFVENMHKFISDQIKLQKIQPIKTDKPLKIEYHVKTVYNHGSISLRAKGLTWKPPQKGYVPNYDLDNVLGVWEKTGNDSLTLCGIIPDDNVSIIQEISKKITFVDDIEDRSLTIKIYEIDVST